MFGNAIREGATDSKGARKFVSKGEKVINHFDASSVYSLGLSQILPYTENNLNILSAGKSYWKLMTMLKLDMH